MSPCLTRTFRVVLAIASLSITSGIASGHPPSSARYQLLYIPVYSEIPHGDQQRTLNLAATLSIRNTDRTNSITLKRVDYYDSKGDMTCSYLTKPIILKPMSSREFTVRESDRRGGISASFLVNWESNTSVSAPLAEAIMISTASSQGISFGTSARVLEERE